MLAPYPDQRRNADGHADGNPFAAPLPHNIAAEQALIGALLCHNDAIHRLGDLRPEHFFDSLHQEIYRVASRLIELGEPASPVTIPPHISALPEPDLKRYIVELVNAAASVVDVLGYKRTVRNLASRRALTETGMEMFNAAIYGPVDLDANEVRDRAQAKLDLNREIGLNEREPVRLAEAMARAITAANEAHKRDDGLAGYTTGFRKLDADTGGMRPRDLHIIAGRPSMGKTAFATNTVTAQARAGIPVLLISAEMSAEVIAARVLAGSCDIPATTVLQGRLGSESEAEVSMASLLRAMQADLDAPLFIDESSEPTVQHVASLTRRMVRKHGIRVVAIDYLQLMRGTMYRGTNRNLEITEITNGLKALAKEQNVAIILLSQLSREVEKRTDKRPLLSDLRDSGAIEQDADIVMFVYREAYYVQQQRPDPDSVEYLEWQKKLAAASGKAEIIVAK